MRMLIFCCIPANCVAMASKTWVSSDVAFTELVEVGYRRVVGHLSYFKGQSRRRGAMRRAYWSSPQRREIASFRVQRNECG